LLNVGTHYELELTTSILAQDGILVMKKSQGWVLIRMLSWGLP
jgi:hypothetical protein